MNLVYLTRTKSKYTYVHCIALIFEITNLHTICFCSHKDAMKNIPMSVFHRLLDDSVKLQKSNATIEKLKNTLRQKTEEIKKLRKCKIRTSTDVSKSLLIP